MGKTIVVCVAAIAFGSGCATKKPEAPVPGAETVRVGTSHPGASFFELGPVSGVDGQGCGDDGKRGSRDAAVASLMKNAFAMGGTHVQVQARELQSLRYAGTITQPEFEKLKASMIR